VGPPLGHGGEEHAVLAQGLLGEHAPHDLDSRALEEREAAPGHERVRITDRRHQAGDPRLHEGGRARPCAPRVGAGLERDIEGRAPSPGARGRERLDLGVRASRPEVGPLTHDRARPRDDDRANHRVR